MCLLEIVGLVMLIGGIVALITGKVQLTKAKVVTGWKARLVGGVMTLTLPLIFCVALMGGMFVGVSGGTEDDAVGVALVLSLAAFLLCVATTIVLIVVWAEPVDGRQFVERAGAPPYPHGPAPPPPGPPLSGPPREG